MKCPRLFEPCSSAIDKIQLIGRLQSNTLPAPIPCKIRCAVPIAAGFLLDGSGPPKATVTQNDGQKRSGRKQDASQENRQLLSSLGLASAGDHGIQFCNAALFQNENRRQHSEQKSTICLIDSRGTYRAP